MQTSKSAHLKMHLVSRFWFLLPGAACLSRVSCEIISRVGQSCLISKMPYLGMSISMPCTWGEVVHLCVFFIWSHLLLNCFRRCFHFLYQQYQQYQQYCGNISNFSNINKIAAISRLRWHQCQRRHQCQRHCWLCQGFFSSISAIS